MAPGRPLRHLPLGYPSLWITEISIWPLETTAPPLLPKVEYQSHLSSRECFESAWKLMAPPLQKIPDDPEWREPWTTTERTGCWFCCTHWVSPGSWSPHGGRTDSGPSPEGPLSPAQHVETSRRQTVQRKQPWQLRGHKNTKYSSLTMSLSQQWSLPLAGVMFFWLLRSYLPSSTWAGCVGPSKLKQTGNVSKIPESPGCTAIQSS